RARHRLAPFGLVRTTVERVQPQLVVERRQVSREMSSRYSDSHSYAESEEDQTGDHARHGTNLGFHVNLLIRPGIAPGSTQSVPGSAGWRSSRFGRSTLSARERRLC